MGGNRITGHLMTSSHGGSASIALPCDRVRDRKRYRLRDFVLSQYRARRGTDPPPKELKNIDAAISALMRVPGGTSEKAVRRLADRFSDTRAPAPEINLSEELELAPLLAGIPLAAQAVDALPPPPPTRQMRPPRPMSAPIPPQFQAEVPQLAETLPTADATAEAADPPSPSPMMSLSDSLRRQREKGVGHQLSAPAKRERRLAAEMMWSQSAWSESRGALEEADAAKRKEREMRQKQRKELDGQIELRKQQRAREAQEAAEVAKEVSLNIERYAEYQKQQAARRREEAESEKRIREAQVQAQRIHRRQEEAKEAAEDAFYAQRAKEELRMARDWERERRQKERRGLEESLADAKKKAEDRRSELRQRQASERDDLGAPPEDRTLQVALERVKRVTVRNQAVSQRWTHSAVSAQKLMDMAGERADKEQQKRLALEDKRRAVRQQKQLEARSLFRKTLDEQVQEKRHKLAVEKASAEAERAGLNKQRLEIEREESDRRQRQAHERRCLREFLDTQLQLQFHKETQELQTSLGRMGSTPGIAAGSPALSKVSAT